ncbi:RelA/SpoT family protein [Ureaplasma ceti]|uniref:RelA/SpoT family protein n=1 Tax=Ureaplasma ceti TaxID=3119530 RepID=A0ABP9U8X4_9BACT
MSIIEEKINELKTKLIEANYQEPDIQKALAAAEFARIKHNNQFRKSGEPYVIHPICTAIILISWDMDISTIMAGILHDVLEDTITKDEEIEERFGHEVLTLVKYVTKVSLYSKENRKEQLEKSEVQKDYTIQVFLSMSDDLRAMIIKLADRYHNMTTIQYLREDKQRRIAQETLELYAKIAGRLGMYEIKTDLIDMSFAILNPEAYNRTKNSIQSIIDENQDDWNEMTSRIQDIFDSYSIQAKIKSRVKGIHSTWEKEEKGYDIMDIHDIYAIRIIVDNVMDCYKVLGLIHLNFTYLKNAFKDYISSPKMNLYQSIHTTVLKNKTLMEIQIRTNEMDMVANRGLAAHWRYKEFSKTKSVTELAQENNLIHEFLSSSDKSVEEIKKLTNDVIFEILILNDESKLVVNNKTRVIDVATKWNPDYVKRLKAIYINGEKVPFYTAVNPGDTLKFSYANKITFEESWLKLSNHPNTLEVFKNILAENETKKLANSNDFVRKIKDFLGDNFIGYDKLILFLQNNMGVNTLEEFLEIVPYDVYNDTDLINIFDKRKKVSRDAFKNFNKKYAEWRMNLLYLKPLEGLFFDSLSFPNCCNKVPKMDIVGLLIDHDVLEVHSHDCAKLDAAREKKQKIYPLVWNDKQLESRPKNFKFTGTFEAMWTPTIGNIIAKMFNKFKLDISELKIKRDKVDNSCSVSFVVYVSGISCVNCCFKKLGEEINIIKMPKI